MTGPCAEKPRAAVIGGGLAGCEAAVSLARLGHAVDLFEMKPLKFSPAHSREDLGELVCSNSLGSNDPTSAPGSLKEELRELGSVVMAAADRTGVPAGKALAVDREQFAAALTGIVRREARIRVIRRECRRVPDGYEVAVVATGPLTSDALAEDLAGRMGAASLYFYDSISPIVTAESIDYRKTYFANRYEPEGRDYLNCPMDRELYERFVEEVRRGEKTPVRAFESFRCFEACLPLELLAERGVRTLAFGPMKPVGLADPRTGRRPYAVAQLRRENEPTTLYNLVGFQTRLSRGEQKRIFRMIPGLENAEFARFGSMHRNTYVDAPRVLTPELALRADRGIFLAGQITGAEGYVESAATGLWAGLAAGAGLRGEPLPAPPPESAMGALLKAIVTAPLHGAFAPMNMNFGLFPPAARGAGHGDRRRETLERAREAARRWRGELTAAGPAAPAREIPAFHAHRS